MWTRRQRFCCKLKSWEVALFQLFYSENDWEDYQQRFSGKDKRELITMGLFRLSVRLFNKLIILGRH